MSDLTIHLHPASLAKWQSENLEWKRYDYPLNSESKVLDLGAYNGEFSHEIFHQYACYVTAIEPTDAADQIANPPIMVNKFAVATFDGTAVFGGAYYYTSVYEKKPDWGSRTYPCRDVNHWLINTQWDLVKINIEGAEYELLEHIIKTGTIHNIKYLQVQFHLIDDTSRQRYAQIRLDLLQTHRCSWRYEFCWESWEKK